MTIPSVPSSWSTLSWQQLCQMWDCKQRYGGNADVARAAALLLLVCGEGFRVKAPVTDGRTGEAVYTIDGKDGQLWTLTPRELSHMAKKAMPWFDYPYGDPGDPAVKDEKGKIVKESRDPVYGYVSPMRDAMIVPVESVKVGYSRFALPQVACNNLTWEQYRSLQAIVPQLFAEGISDSDVLDLQAQFLAHILTPRVIVLFDTAGGSIRLRPHYDYRYNADQAEGIARRFSRRMKSDRMMGTLYHICFQTYQTAMTYYRASYPLLFQDSGKSDPMKDALTGEVGTINVIMMKANYTSQQEVYDSKMPYIFDILNVMTKEAKEIERMNAKIKKK